jgi:hypothetical protein
MSIRFDRHVQHVRMATHGAIFNIFLLTSCTDVYFYDDLFTTESAAIGMFYEHEGMVPCRASLCSVMLGSPQGTFCYRSRRTMLPLSRIAFLACLSMTLLTSKAFSEELLMYEPAPDLPGNGRRVVLVAGDEEYRSEEALPMLGKLLARRHGFHCTVLFSLNEEGVIDPDARGNIPGLQALDNADFMVLFTRFRRLPDEDMKHLVDYVESGRPMLAIRTATHAFAYERDSESPYAHWSWDNRDTWLGGFGREILGETWVNHHGGHGSQSTRGVVPDAVRKHPLVRGVEDVWGPTDVYGIRDLPEDAVVLLEGSVQEGMTPEAPAVDGPQNAPRMPIVWLRNRPLDNGKVQRIVTSTLGASVDLNSEDLRRLFVNTAYWGVGLEEQIPDRSDASLVGDYEPTMFGFGSFVQGLRPEDHRLPEPDNSRH